MKNVTDYIWFKEIFNKEEIEQIHKIAEGFPLQEGTTFGKDSTYRRSEIKWLGYNTETKWIYDRLIECMKEANDMSYGFEWEGNTEAIQYTTYDSSVKGHYDWHMDIGPEKDNSTQHLRKLSASVMLNDEYKGGELELWDKDLEGVYGTGNCMVFPSFYLHKVKPVTSGIRHSLVIWGVANEPFK